MGDRLGTPGATGGMGSDISAPQRHWTELKLPPRCYLVLVSVSGKGSPSSRATTNGVKNCMNCITYSFKY